MKIVAMVITLLVGVFELWATSLVVTADVTSNTTWEADTVVVDAATFTVQAGARLTINPGTVVKFKSGQRFITVRGTITAVGTVNDSIYFSHVKSGITWQGIRIVNRSNGIDTSYIRYCNLKGAHCSDVDSAYMKRGAAIYCGAGNYVEVSDCFISENEGYHGGAVYIDSGSVVYINRSNFLGNTASIFGGGAIKTCDKGEAALFVQECRFSYNNGRTGGAMLIGKDCKTSINNCIFYRDTTHKINPQNNDLRGGALALIRSVDVTLRGCIILYCHSYEKGGGIYSEDAALKLINCTIVNNTSVHGGGVYFARKNSASSPEVINTIIDGNGTLFSVKIPCDSAGCPVFIDSLVTPVFRHCQMSDTVYDYTAHQYEGEFKECRYANTDFLYSRPGHNMSDTIIEGYQLFNATLKKNPAVDGGTPDTSGLGLPETDLLGQKRVFGDTVDIGAIENNDSIFITNSVYKVGKNQFLSSDMPTFMMVYTIDGRKLREFKAANSQQSVRHFVNATYPRGLYIIVGKKAAGVAWTLTHIVE